MALPVNGYIGVTNEWKEIDKRYIGISGFWVPQTEQFSSLNNKWVLTYTDPPIDTTQDVYVRNLEEYIVASGATLTATGVNLLSSQLISQQLGAYYELTKDTTDLFANFGNATVNGAAQFIDYNTTGVFQAVSCLKFNGSSTSVTLPSTLDAANLFGAAGNANYMISIRFWIPDFAPSDPSPIMCYGNRTNGMEIGVTNDGRIRQTMWNANVASIIQTAANIVQAGQWNSFVIRRITNITQIWIPVGGLSNSDKEMHLNAQLTVPMIAPGAGIPIHVGLNFDSSSTPYSRSTMAYKYIYLEPNFISQPNDLQELQRLIYRKNVEALIYYDTTGVSQIFENNYTITDTSILIPIIQTDSLNDFQVDSGRIQFYSYGDLNGQKIFKQDTFESHNFPFRIIP